MHYPFLDLTDFCFILILFVLPALFSPVTGSVTIPESGNIPWMTVLVYGLLVVYMIIRYHHAQKHTQTDHQKDTTAKGKSLKILTFFTSTVTTFLMLTFTNFIVTRIATDFSGFSPVPSVSATVETEADKLILVLWTILLATFEEFTYRWLLPVRLRSFWIERRPADAYTTTRKILCEAAIICLFALAHRYMGWWAVLNALLAGTILRTCFFKTGSVYPALIAHVLYNLTVFYGILNL